MSRYDDDHRGPAVTNAYELSRCWMELAQAADHWPVTEKGPEHLQQIAGQAPKDQREDWLRRAVNNEEAERLLANAMRSGELPIWVAPIDETERLVAPSALLELDRATIVSGCYRPPNDRGWLYGRPLFVKREDWKLFLSSVLIKKSLQLRSSQLDIPVPSSIMDIGAVIDLARAIKLLAQVDPTPSIEISENRLTDPAFGPASEERLHSNEPTGIANFIAKNFEAEITIIAALRRSDLEAYFSVDGVKRSHLIPQSYWLNITPEKLDLTYQGGRSNELGKGCPILLVRADFEQWLSEIAPKTGTSDKKDTRKSRKRPGPKPDPNWKFAIASVTHNCILAGYKRPLRRGDKAAIQIMLLDFMAEKNKYFSEDTAAKYAEEVIAALPDG